MEFENLRKYLMEDDEDKLKEIEIEISDKDKLYIFLCEFYTQCDVKGMDMHAGSRNFIIEYVVEYRMKFAKKNPIKNDSEEPENVIKRIKLLKEIINDNKEIKELNPIELITFLKTVVRIMRPLIYDKTASRLPWAKIQFVICIFIATKIDKNLQPDWLLDNYYQLIVTEKFIAKLMRLLLSRLEDKTTETVDWSELDDVFNISKMYYLVLKMNWRYHHFDYKSERNIKANYLQTMGEWVYQLKKLDYSDFEDSSYMTQKLNLFSTILVDVRNKLSHSHKISYFNLNVDNLGLFIIELVQIVRLKIEERILKEFKTILAQSVDELLERVNKLSFTIFSNNRFIKLEPFEIIKEIMNVNKYKNYSAAICDIGSKLMYILAPERYSNETFFNFINNLKRNSKILKEGSENPNLCIEVIMAQLNQISPQPFVNIKTLLSMFLSLIPDSKPKQKLEKWLNNLNTDYVTEKPRNSDDETFIQYIFLKIEKCIKDKNDKNEFSRTVSKLMKERSDFYESKIFKDSKLSQLRNNPVQSIIKNKNKNMPEHKIVDKFLRDINWKNIKTIIAKISNEKTINFSLNNELFDSDKPDVYEKCFQFVIEAFGLAPKLGTEFSYDFNFLDFDCPIPVGRNMRNYLAHGDICIDVLCPDIKMVIIEHYKFFILKKVNKQKLGFSRPDDFDLIRNNFRKQMRWAREAWELLNWNNNMKILEKYESNPMAFRVRDPAGLTIVHYSLKEINKSNVILNFFIRRFKNKCSTQDKHYIQDELIEKILTIYFGKSEDLLDYNFVSFRDMNRKNFVETIAQVICLNCPDIEIFKSVFSLIETNLNWYQRSTLVNVCKPLQIAVAQNHTEIVKYLLNHDSFKREIYSEFKGFTALEYAIMNGNIEMARIFIDNGANVHHKSTSQYLTDYGAYVDWKSDRTLLNNNLRNCSFRDEECPFSVVLAYGDPEMILLLKSKRMKPDNELIFDIQRKIKININPEVWTCILNSFCKTEEDFEMLLHIACINEKFDIVKSIIESKPLDWSSVKETILISCYNLKSPEILKYLLEKGAVLKLEHLKLICTFGSTEVVEYLIGNGYLKEFMGKDLIGRNKEIVAVLSNQNCKIDWKAIDFLPLAFVLEQNPPQDFLREQISNFFMLSSSKTKSELIKYLNERRIRIPLYVLEYAATEIGLEKCNWLKKVEFEETPDEWNKLLVIAVTTDHYVLARIALKRGANIDISIDEETLLDFYIERNGGIVSEMMKLLSEFKGPSRFRIDFCNFTVQDQLLFGHLTKNGEMIKTAEEEADLNFKYRIFRDGTILHVIYHYGIKLGSNEEEYSIRNIDNCSPFDLLVLNNPFRPLPSHFSKISPFQRLIAGILRSNFEVMEDALESGADLNSVVDHFNYYTPLHVAVRENLIKVVEYLLRNGSNLYVKYRFQRMPIETSIICCDNDSMVELLLQHMTDLAKDNIDDLLKLTRRENRQKGYKVLIQSKQNNLKSKTDFETALERGLNINSVPNDYQETYLHFASYNSDYELVKFLFENGADSLVKNCFNELPIERAVVKDDSSIVELLVHECINTKLLELAFENNSLKSTKMLLKPRLILFLHSIDPFQYLCRMPNNEGLELTKLLFKFEDDCYKLCVYFIRAVDNCNYILAKLILIEVYGRTGIKLYNYKDFEMALEKGIDFNRGRKLAFFMGNKIPLLHYATFSCEPNVVELLLKIGADPFITDCFKQLPIEYAIRLDDVKKVRLLFEGQRFELIANNFDDDLDDDNDYNDISDNDDEWLSYNLTHLLLLATKCYGFKSVEFLIQNGFKKIKKKPQILDDMLIIACGLELNKGLEIVTYILEINLKPLDLKKLLNISKENNNFLVANLLISIINQNSCNEVPFSLSLPCPSSKTPPL